MLDIQKTAIARLINALNGAGADYKIILPDGTEYGTLETKPVKKAKPKSSRASPYPRGELSGYIAPFLSGMVAGDVMVIPYDKYPGTLLAARCYSAGFDAWGKGNCMGSRNDKTKTVEIMRLG
jgi:hypothetical protein